jgi:hypothetical protein
MMRAPEPAPHEDEAEHTVEGYWQPSKWWQAVKDGVMVCETSTPNHDDAFQNALNDGATARQRVDFIPTVCRWLEHEPAVRWMPQATYDALPQKNPATLYYIREELL